MKKILFIIVTILAFSCSEDFLDIAPETSLTSATFYQTEDHFEQALTAAYVPLRTIDLCGIYMDEMRSDNTFYTYYPNDRSYYYTEMIALFLDDELYTGFIQDRYDDDYVGISRVNTILDRIDDADFSDEVKAEIIGEASFLRAFYYFDLVVHFGGVPLQLHEVTNEADAYLARSSEDEVYTQIISDLETAIGNLEVATSFPQSGEATKGAAQMLLAYVYMTKTEREYSKAEEQLRDILDMNYALLDNYADVFDTNNENSKESIFEVQYKDGDTDQENDYIWRFVPRAQNNDFLMGITATTKGGWNVPTQEMIDSYEEGDTRLNVSIGVVEGTGDQADNDFYAEEVKNIVGYTPTEGKTYYYFIRKYFFPPYEKEYNTGTNWPVFRYADALLLLAECLVEQGKNSEATPFLNQVRTRAGLAAVSEASKENVANERRHELAFENHRWRDLVRTGDAIDEMNAFGEKMKSLYNFIPSSAFNVTEERLIFPIPYRELQVNDLLEQNPGY